MNYPQEPASLPAAPAPVGERLCDYLRKVRESKRVTLDKMARDTKLNLDYLYALEQGDYQAIPAETYIRIYLRSVAKYLQLDPNEIIARYQKETTKVEEPTVEEKKTTRGLAAIARQPKIKPIGVVVFIFAIIIIFSFLRTSRQREAPVPPPSLVDSAAKDSGTAAAAQNAPADNVPPVPADSLHKGVPAPTADTVAKKSVPEKRDSMVMTITCVKESCWVMVLHDFKNPARLFLRNNETLSFKADSIFHVSLGQAGTVTVTLSGKKVNLPARNLLRFSLGRHGFRKLSYLEWVKRFPLLRDAAKSPSSDSL